MRWPILRSRATRVKNALLTTSSNEAYKIEAVAAFGSTASARRIMVLVVQYLIE